MKLLNTHNPRRLDVFEHITSSAHMKEANASPVSLASQKAGEGPEVLCHSVGNQRGFGGWEGLDHVGGRLAGSECGCLTRFFSQFPERPSSWYRDVSEESDLT